MKYYIGILLCVIANQALAASYTIGPLGINSKGLCLDGSGVHIGQAEVLGRSGAFGYDEMPENYNSQVKPFKVYRGVTQDGKDSNNIDEHATWVAGVMIADGSLYGGINEGVAPGALLHSAGQGSGPDDYANMALTMYGLAKQQPMRAVNMSFGTALAGGESIMENAYLTEFVDWSARVHDVLYVAGHPYYERPGVTPADNYNGITVGASEIYPSGEFGAYYSRPWSQNYYDENPPFRSLTDILAPGVEIRVTALDDEDLLLDGSSQAAPHVTGAIALLQQYAVREFNNSNPRFIPQSFEKHQVMKAVLMNGADKLDGVLGSNRDITTQNNLKWTDTLAYIAPSLSLDPELGVGHLNVKSSLDNLKPGEYNASVPNNPSTYVPTTGWDFGVSGGTGIWTEYYFNEPLSGWFSATLAWDRHVASSNAIEDRYDYGDLFFNDTLENQLTNLGLYLMPADRNDLIFAIEWSNDPSENLEHIFWNIEDEGMYKLVVVNHGDRGDSEEYGLAWRSELDVSPLGGDFDGDGDVDGRDLLEWQRGNSPDPHSSCDLCSWQSNYGSTSSLTAVSTAVPEPSSMIIILLVGMALTGQRFRLGYAMLGFATFPHRDDATT
jgi:hypothetical protein